MIFLSVVFSLFHTCLGKDGTTSEIGAVLKWTQPEEIRLETQLLWDEKEIVTEFWLNTDGKQYKVICSQLSFNTQAGVPLTTYMVRVGVTDSYDVEHCEVTSCNELAIRASIATAHIDKGHRLYYKDKKGICHWRDYEIDTTALTVTVCRTNVVQTDCPAELHSELSTNGIVTSWSPAGKWHLTDFPSDKQLTKLRLSTAKSGLRYCGENCWIVCKEHTWFEPMINSDGQHIENVQSAQVADIRAYDILLDRLQVTSCTKTFLETSIKFVSRTFDGDDTTYEIIYMKEDGNCYKRQFVEKTTMLSSSPARQMSITRSDPGETQCPKDMKMNRMLPTMERSVKAVLSRIGSIIPKNTDKQPNT